MKSLPPKLSDLSSPDMERAILAALINAEDGSVKEKCQESLPPEAFTDTKHKAIYKIIMSNGRLLDLLSLWREIENRGFTGLIDKNYLIAVAFSATGTAHADYYINELTKCRRNLERGFVDPLEFPSEIISGVAASFVEVLSKYIEAPPQFIYMAFLTCLGAALAKKLSLATVIKVQPRLYIVLIGPSGMSRKSTTILLTIDFFKETLTRDFKLDICWGVGSDIGLLTRLKKANSLLLAMDEFKQLTSKSAIKASSLLPCISTLYDRNEYENQTKKENIVVQNGYLSLLAASTPDTYESTWDPEFTNIGLNNRLFIVPGEGEKHPEFPPEIPLQEYMPVKKRIGEIFQLFGESLRLELTPHAKDKYSQWYGDLENSTHSQRLEAYALRFMSLLSVNELRTQVDEDIVEKAITLCNWQLAVRKIYDPVSADSTVAKMEEKIRLQLSTRGPMTNRELFNFTNARRAGRWCFDTALKNLIRGEEVRVEKASKKYSLFQV